LSLVTHVKPNQTTKKERTMMHFSCHEREKRKKKHKQLITSSNPTMMSIYTSQCGKGHGCVFSDTLVGQIWSPINVSHAFLMTQAPPTRWDVWNMFKQLFD